MGLRAKDMSRISTISTKEETAAAADDARPRAELARVTRLTTLGQAMGVIAHEIKQPLAAIVTNGNAGLRWLNGETPNIAEAKLCLQRVVGDGHRVAQTVQNIRTMFEDKLADIGPVDLNEVVRDVLALLDGELRDRVKVELDLAPGLPPAVIGRTQLEQVVLNLVMNAIEAMEPGDAQAHVLRIASALNGANVMLTVEDRGVGIPVENMHRIFNPFFTTKPQALGLGLTICRSLVEAQGGRVHAAAAVPRGTGVDVVLVAATPDTT